MSGISLILLSGTIPDNAVFNSVIEHSVFNFNNIIKWRPQFWVSNISHINTVNLLFKTCHEWQALKYSNELRDRDDTITYVHYGWRFIYFIPDVMQTCENRMTLRLFMSVINVGINLYNCDCNVNKWYVLNKHVILLYYRLGFHMSFAVRQSCPLCLCVFL